ncbi:MAG: 4Fe-4S dicluster domain-containing protein [Candidatus Syntropharchaeia archaeon]
MIGVYICHCGINIAATVDVEKVREFAASLPNVKIARDYQYMCSDPGQELIKKDIKELGLKKVVVASCSPRMHEPTFRGVVQEAGLNPFCFEQANIREHCSWVHHDREKATKKAMDLVKSAVAKATLLEPLEEREVGVIPATLVIGGGIAGIQAALDIADAGFKVYLVEKEPSIGGRVAQIEKLFPTMDTASSVLEPKMKTVGEHPNIELLTSSEVIEVGGYIGNFTAKIRKKARYVDVEKCTACGKCEEVCPSKVPDEFNLGKKERSAIYLPFSYAFPFAYVIDRENCAEGCTKCADVCDEKAINFDDSDEEIEVGIGSIVVATGYDPFDAKLKEEYGYGLYDEVITGLELERMLSESGPTGGEIVINGKTPKKIAFIQCVGSRDKNVGNEYCSRVCCMYTAKQARMIKEKIPDAQVTVCYMDVRAFGKGYEEFYEETQKSGILYMRGNVSEIYKKNGNLVIRAEDTLLGEPYEEEFDMVVLATGLVARENTRDIGNLLKISRSADGFFLEAHPKLRPVDTATDGVYLAGCCQGPKDITDTIAQANGTAARACIPLFAGKVRIEPTTSSIDEEICSGCRMCEKVCAYGALVFDEERGIMTVNEVVCKGCGSCGTTCPSGAASMKHFRDGQIFAQIEVVV